MTLSPNTQINNLCQGGVAPPPRSLLVGSIRINTNWQRVTSAPGFLPLAWKNSPRWPAASRPNNRNRGGDSPSGRSLFLVSDLFVLVFGRPRRPGDGGVQNPGVETRRGRFKAGRSSVKHSFVLSGSHLELLGGGGGGVS